MVGAVRARPGSRLAVRVDGSDKTPVAAVRAYVTGSDGRAAVPDGATMLLTESPFGREKHAVTGGGFEVDMPAGPATVRVERGTEFVPAVATLHLREGEHRRVRLLPRRWTDPASDGWYCGDLHGHRDPADMPRLLQAEMLHVGSSIATHNGADARPGAPPPTGRWTRVYDGRAFSANDAEVERLDGGPGAIVGVGLPRPLRFECDAWTPLDATVADRIRAAGGLVDAEKPFWPVVPALVALGKVDSVGLACNHLGRTWTYLSVGSLGGVEPDGGISSGQQLVDWICGTYHRFLNCGFMLAASGGSASGWMPNPPGHARTYVHVPEGFAPGRWLEHLRRGRTFATTGPMLALDVDGRAPGDRLPAIAARARRLVVAEATWWRPVDRLELIHNGDVVAEGKPVAGPDRRHLRIETELPGLAGGWVCARAVAADGDRIDLAHSSPVELGGYPPPRRQRDAAALRRWLERWEERLRRHGGAPAPPAELFAQLRAAREVYRRLER